MPITAAETDIPVVLAEALELGRAAAPSGKVANYIPELAKADPNLVGLTVHRLDGTEDVAGDAQATFTLQSVSKVFFSPMRCARRETPFSTVCHANPAATHFIPSSGLRKNSAARAILTSMPAPSWSRACCRVAGPMRK